MEFIDLKAQYKHIQNNLHKNLNTVLENTNFIMGNEVQEFEEKFASYIGVKHVVACSDGTAALQMAYMAYGIGAGDAVFCPDLTFIGSIEPACMLGATPIFCDIDPISYNLSPEKLEQQIKAVIKEGVLTPKAIVAVDFVGNPADYDTLEIIAKKYNLLLIEDAAQGTGASVNGKMCGAFGDIATTSFFPSKPLGCYGDGGAVLTNDDEIADVLKSLRVHGKGTSKYDNIRIGINSRLDTVQAAILQAKLEVLSEEMDKRQIIANRYTKAFEGKLITPVIKSGDIASYAQYVLLAANTKQRDELMEELKNQSIPTLIYYPKPMHKLPVFKDLNFYQDTFEYATDYCNRTFSIPFSPYLLEEDQDRVIEVVLNKLHS